MLYRFTMAAAVLGLASFEAFAPAAAHADAPFGLVNVRAAQCGRHGVADCPQPPASPIPPPGVQNGPQAAAFPQGDLDKLRARTGVLYVDTNPDPNVEERHWCTGFILSSDGNASIVATAGHCIQSASNGAYYDVISFNPSSTPSSTPTSMPPVAQCRQALQGWTAIIGPYLRIRGDVGFVKVQHAIAPDGLTVTLPIDPVSWQSDIRILGFPAIGSQPGTLTVLAEPLNADVLHLALLAVVNTDTAFRQGTSGGPWLARSGNSYRLLGVNSSFSWPLYDGGPVRLYAADIGRNAGPQDTALNVQSLLDSVSACH